MKIKFFVFVVFTLLLYCLNACNNQSENAVRETSTQPEDSLQNRNIEQDRCVSCDSLYQDFPLSVNDFEQEYGVGNYNLEIYIDPAEDYIRLFTCLDSCYDQSIFERALRLGGNIHYEPDGPMLFQYELVNFAIRNDMLYSQAIKSLSNQEAAKAIDFFFVGLPKHDSFRPKLCDFMSRVLTPGEYKKLIRTSYCDDN